MVCPWIPRHRRRGYSIATAKGAVECAVIEVTDDHKVAATVATGDDFTIRLYFQSFKTVVNTTGNISGYHTGCAKAGVYGAVDIVPSEHKLRTGITCGDNFPVLLTGDTCGEVVTGCYRCDFNTIAAAKGAIKGTVGVVSNQ